MARICTLALVTAVAIGGTLPGSSIYACDDRPAPGCQHAVTPLSAAAAAFDHRSIKAESGRRRARHQRPDEASPHVTALSVATRPDKDTGIPLQQFQRFVSKQSMANASAEELRTPWLEPALFAVTGTSPVGGGLIPASDDEFLSQARASDVANNFKQPTANEVVVDDHNDFSDESRRASGERRMMAAQTRASDNDPASISWIELAFLVWGGLLTVGSGLRLIFG